MTEPGNLYSHAARQADKAIALADTLTSRHPDHPDGYVVRAWIRMDDPRPDRHDATRYFLSHVGNLFGDLPDQQQPAADRCAGLARQPPPVGAG